MKPDTLYLRWAGLSILLALLMFPALVGAAPEAPTELAPPVRLTPPDGAETTGNSADTTPGRLLFEPLGVPCFRWEPVAGATKYWLEVSEIAGDSAIVLTRNDIRQPIYCPTSFELQGHGLQDEMTYYWRVRAYGGTPAGWSVPPDQWWSFIRHWGHIPALRAPVVDAVLYRAPVLEWIKVDGVEYYIVEVSSDATFPDPGGLSWPNFTYRLKTRNNMFALASLSVGNSSTPLPNDQDIYWRVRPVSEGNVNESYRLGPWSDNGVGRKFSLCWSCNLDTELGPGNERRPVPLTPVRLSSHINSPYFSWTPVEGATAYDIEINLSSGFPGQHRLKVFRTTATGILAPIDQYWDYVPTAAPIYWRVRAVGLFLGKEVDGEWNNETPDISGQFYPEYQSGAPSAPDPLFPEYYFPPVHVTAGWEDRTTATPVFMWNQVPNAVSYTLQVAPTAGFTATTWQHTTQNLSATPVQRQPFANTGVYYWRVKANTGAWSQAWKTRVNLNALPISPTVGLPSLIHPLYQKEDDQNIYGQQVLEHFPYLQWTPVSGADHYEVQIATGSEFGATVLETTATELTAYTPVTRYPPDTYYWRVRALDGGGNPLGAGEGWSGGAHFLLARQFSSEPLFDVVSNRAHQAFSPAALLTTDPYSDHVGASGDLVAQYTALDNNYWYFGWSVSLENPVRYQLYLDAEQADETGGVNPQGGALPYSGEPYRPEYVIEWDMFTTGTPTVTLYTASGDAWTPTPLYDINGRAAYVTEEIYSGTLGYVMIAVPHGAVRSPVTMNGLLVALDPTNNQVLDQMALGYVSVTTSPTPRTPPGAHSNPSLATVYPRMPLMTWHTLSNLYTMRFRSSTDDSFSTMVEEGYMPRPMGFCAFNPYYRSNRIYPDNNTYYWQVRSVYLDPWYPDDAIARETTWSRAVRFAKQAPLPTNLQVATTVFTETISGTVPYVDETPLFSWDTLQDGPGFRFELIGGNYQETLEGTASNFYMPSRALPNGDFVWRVRVIDGSGNWNANTYAEGRFSKGSNVPELLYPQSDFVFTGTVYFQWRPLKGASFYRLEVDSLPSLKQGNPNYSISERINNTYYTPPAAIPKAITSGVFYWRVCSYDGNENFMGCEAYYVAPEQIFLPLVMRAKK